MTLVVLPGMGASAAMYAGAWRTLEARFVDWPAYRGERTLGALAERVLEEERLDADDVPAGTSLGGMVALEIAARLGSRAVLLISAATDASEVSAILRRAAPLARVAPIGAALALGRLVRVPGLSRTVEPAFVRAMCLAIPRWSGPRFDGALLRVHGERDRVIRCPAGASCVAGAGHLAAITHAAQCVAAARALLGRLEAG